MQRETLRQINSLLMEIEEEERRRYELGAWSLFHDDGAARERNTDTIRTIAGWIESIPDSRVRRAFTLRYVDGLSWTRVAMRMGYQSPDGPRKLCARYLGKESQKGV